MAHHEGVEIIETECSVTHSASSGSGATAMSRTALAKLMVAWIAVLTLSGCGDEKGTGVSAEAPEPAGAADVVRAHPISATAPAGFTLVTAGRGGWLQSWGDDSEGNDSPFTVVSDGSRTVTIASLGYEGMQGKLDQAFGYYPDGESLTVGGDPARFIPVHAGLADPILGVERGDDLAISLSGADLSKDELIALAERVAPSQDHAVAPTVSDLPTPWKFVGSVNAQLLGAVEGYFAAGGETGPGPTSGYGLGFLSGENRLSVTSLDSDVADLDALIPTSTWNEQVTVKGRAVSVAGAPGVVLDLCHCSIPGSDTRRALVTHDSTGALLVVSARVLSVPDEQTLIDVAASAKPVDVGAWEAGVEDTRMRAANGPGLNPDVGEVEVLRGTEGDLDWLLQTAHESGMGGVSVAVDLCLKLSDYTRTCALPRGSDQHGATFNVAMASEVIDGLRSFMILTIPTKAVTDASGVSVKVTTQKGSAIAQLTAVPGTDTSTAVVFVEDAGTPVCTTDPKPPESMKPMSVQVLDAAGRSTMCIGY